ncbi:MAG: hypothetical protein JO101_03035 [Candidatus Eremiobacteraeota bacterium]|nr:hypothetical protein [Candidatus Eremiobacteraeota bacterium]MBV8354267.1 hypothetical protein [Candidatus Eremiobacteraeota bacterium]
MTTSDRDAAKNLAHRIKGKMTDPATLDEAGQAPGDKPPAYADTLMSEAPLSIERATDVKNEDWALIERALEHYASCRAA